MELICSTKIQKYSPRASYIAPNIRLPNGYDSSLIGQDIDVYKTEGGLFISLKIDKIESSGETNPPPVKTYIQEDSTKETQIESKNANASCCYSVVRPIMRASHARDWGSNPHNSTRSLG